MTHDEAQARWHERLETGAPDPELAQHLEACAACRAYTREMSVVLDALNTARRETETLPTAASEAARGPAHYRFGGGRWRLMRTAAMVALTCGAVYWAFAPTRPPVGTKSPIVKKTNAAHARTYGITLRGESASRQFAVADKASTEEVQVYWVYTSLTSKEDSEHPSKTKNDRSG